MPHSPINNNKVGAGISHLGLESEEGLSVCLGGDEGGGDDDDEGSHTLLNKNS